jgi:hypothetical protein
MSLRKVLAAAFSISLIAAMQASAALSVTIAGLGESTLYDSFGTLLTGNGLTFQLVIDDDVNTDFGSLVSARQLNINSETLFAGGTHNSALDDIVAGTWQWTYDGAGKHYVQDGISYEHTFSGIDEQYTSDRFYVRWFNAGNTEAGFIYSSNYADTENWYTPASGALTVNTQDISYWDYGTTDRLTGNDGTMYGTSGWQTVAPVPEPTALALLALGMTTLAVRRRKRG